MKTAGVTAGVAATYGGATQLDALDPVGEADALVITGTTVAAATAGAGVALIVADQFDAGTDGNVDTQDVLEDQIHSIGTSVAAGRESWVDEMTTQFIDSQQGQSPYADAAWQEIRAATVKGVVNGKSESEVEQLATDALQKQTTRSVVNTVERYNTGMDALQEALVIDYENNVGSLQDTGDDIGPLTDSPPSGWSTVSTSEVQSGGHALVETDALDLPTPATDLDGRDEPLTLLAHVLTITNQYPANIMHDSSAIGWYTGGETTDYEQLQVTHSSLSTETVFDHKTYYDVLKRIYDEYQSISSDLSTYVTNVYEQVEEGALDPSDVLSSQDIVDQFASSDAQTRLAAEMTAIGAGVPDNAGYEAKVSHPDIQSDSLWGNLYIRFSGDPQPVTPGKTIASADYSVAYFGFYSENAGEYRSRVLSGSSDLQILDVAGLPDEQDATSGAADVADSSANVVIYEGDDPPEPIEFPQDHSNWQIVVEGASNTSTHAPTDVVVEGSTYTLEATGLNAGEAIESVRLVPPAEYSQPVEYVADPTNPDDGETVKRLEALRDTVDSLEKELDNGGSGGFGLPSLGLGVPDWMVYGGVGLAALFAWSKANEDDGY